MEEEEEAIGAVRAVNAHQAREVANGDGVVVQPVRTEIEGFYAPTAKATPLEGVHAPQSRP